MGLSADAILLSLRLIEERGVAGREMAEHLRAVAEACPPGRAAAPDPLVALQERLLGERPALAEALGDLALDAPYVPMECRGCRARFRVPPAEAGADASCPLCGEPILSGRRLLFLAAHAAPELVAAEAATVYDAGPLGQAGARPRRFAHFDFVRFLGEGGTGRVYEARNRRTGRTVAVKVLRFEPLEPASAALKKLQREARAAAGIACEHLVRVYDMGVAEGVGYIEMEYVAGDTLRNFVERRGALSPREAVRLGREALAGLTAVHAGQVVHGDVKPANILIDAAGRARLTDFGLCHFVEETTSFCGSDRPVGSPHFMAPEQWRGRGVGPRTDLYAAGLVLYFMLTGRLPYEGRSTMALMYAHLHEPLLPAGKALPFPEYLGDVVRRATEKDPERRFESAQEFSDALGALPAPP